MHPTPPLIAALLIAACAGERPPTPPAGAHALAALDLTALRLLPAVAVAAPPVTADAVPAFDRPFADLAPGTSASIGTTRDGYLVGGVPLPTSGPLAARPLSVRRDAVYATPTLVRALGRAAERVDRAWPGSVLWAGDASAAGGGDLPGHASHNSGRDVDLAFYRRGADGRLADIPTLTAFGGDLRAAAGLRFDAARNWALVAALLEDPEVEVQWIFVASYLRDAMLDEARATAARPELIEQASQVLAQPSDSSPHAEHFHVRIYCGAEERLAGCLDARPFHPWAHRRDADLDRFVDGLLPFLDHGWSDELEWAITRLVRMNATSASDRLRRLTSDPDPRVAALATDAVDFLTGRRTPAAWARWRAPEGVLED
ncbi:MAG: hypothetical protein CVU56_11490 [Deltaproteobacteria bacterium HGW-Deltaproteobacteria-14]|jgi:penicillin-insensitive murein endopeptidase|nr:MAG: hypothetical protein CVU56_11490 [Deltaproteobacteria bacterium HGW-Deltaproteobacteria-14]